MKLRFFLLNLFVIDLLSYPINTIKISINKNKNILKKNSEKDSLIFFDFSSTFDFSSFLFFNQTINRLIKEKNNLSIHLFTTLNLNNLNLNLNEEIIIHQIYQKYPQNNDEKKKKSENEINIRNKIQLLIDGYLFYSLIDSLIHLFKDC